MVRTPQQPPGRSELIDEVSGALIVDAAGRVRQVLSWPWSTPPSEEECVWECFDPESALTVASLASRGWLGASERRLRLIDGLWISVCTQQVGEDFRLTLTDATAQEVIGRAMEQRRQMRALSELAGSLARELTDPMAIVQGQLELLLDLGKLSDPVAVRRHLEVALEHARRASTTLRNLRQVGQVEPTKTKAVSFVEVVEETRRLVGPRGQHLVVRIDPENLAIGCDGAVAARVLASLCRHCMDALNRAPIHLNAIRMGAKVEVRIGATGRGGVEEITPGDELSLYRTLLASVGGELEARRFGQVPEFVVRLPMPAGRRIRKKKARAKLVVIGRLSSQHVPEQLARDGYDCIQAETVFQALDCLVQGALATEPAEALITDLLLEGGVSGLSLAEAVVRQYKLGRLRDRCPRLIVVGEGQLGPLPAPLIAMGAPVARTDLLEALGNRVRR